MGEGYSRKVHMGRLHPEVQPLTLIRTIFHKKRTLFLYLLLTNLTNIMWVYGFLNMKKSQNQNTVSALSFDKQNKRFQHGAFACLILRSWKAFVMCYCFRKPTKTFFYAPQMTVTSGALHLFPVSPNSQWFMARTIRSWAANQWEKSSVRNLLSGPRTRSIRGISWSVITQRFDWLHWIIYCSIANLSVW